MLRSEQIFPTHAPAPVTQSLLQTRSIVSAGGSGGEGGNAQLPQNQVVSGLVSQKKGTFESALKSQLVKSVGKRMLGTFTIPDSRLSIFRLRLVWPQS